MGLEVVAVSPETRMPDSRHHTTGLTLKSEGEDKEPDQDRGVLTMSCYFTGDLGDCGTRINY